MCRCGPSAQRCHLMSSHGAQLRWRPVGGSDRRVFRFSFSKWLKQQLDITRLRVRTFLTSGTKPSNWRVAWNVRKRHTNCTFKRALMFMENEGENSRRLKSSFPTSGFDFTSWIFSAYPRLPQSFHPRGRGQHAPWLGAMAGCRSDGVESSNNLTVKGGKLVCQLWSTRSRSIAGPSGCIKHRSKWS